MKKDTFIKISTAIFVILAVIISLFPPFEFGNEKLKTLSERRSNSQIADKLPLKKYDFFFGSNKKYIPLTSFNFTKKFYSRDSVVYYTKLWNDKKFNCNLTSTDTFLTATKFLYEPKGWEITFSKHRGRWPRQDEYSDSIFYVTEGKWEDPIFYKKTALEKLLADPNNYEYNYYQFGEPDTNKFRCETYGNKIIKYNNEETNKDAVNFSSVKDEYEISPDKWNYKYVYKVDSIKKYYEYSITQPVYYLLDRKILLSELLIEYMLAFFVSIILGYLIAKLKLRKALN